MMKKCLYTLAMLMITFGAFAQQEIVIGQKYEIHSAILNEQRECWIYLPPDYHNKNIAPASYPVVYLLDGDANFSAFTGILETLSKGPYASVPQMIVVGILNTNRTRDLTPTPGGRVAFYDKRATMFADGGGNEKFIGFLQKELRPWVDAAFRTSGYNILNGHSFGGLTAVNVLLHHTKLFNAYIVIDPSLWWDDQLLLRQADSILRKKDFTGTNVYLAQANKEVVPQDTTTDHQAAIRQFDTQLASIKPYGMRVQYKFYPEDDHGTVPLPAQFDGLKFIFKGHQVHVKQAVDDPDLVTRHYTALSKQLGFPFKPSESYLDFLGQYCLRVGKKGAAVGFLRMALAYYPQSPAAGTNLAKALNGDTSKAP